MNRRLVVMQAIAALVTATTATPSLAAGHAAASNQRAVTVAVRFATDRTHAPAGEVTDLAGDQSELARLAGILEATEGSTTLLLVDPATRVWLSDFSGTPLQSQADDLAARADARAHMDTVYASARIDKLVASRVSQVADGLLSWSTTPTTVYVPAAMDAKTDAFLAARDSVVTALPADSSTTGAALAGATPKGAQVVVRATSLEACLVASDAGSCVRSELAQSSATHLLAVTPIKVTGPALRTFLAALRNSTGTVLSSTLPTSKDAVEIEETPVARKYPVPLREALVPALHQAQAVAALFPGTKSTTIAQQAVAAAVSDEVDAGVDPLDMLASAAVHSRKALALVRVVTSDRFTVSGDSAEIPVTVLNDSATSVTVTVALRPDSTDRLSPFTSERLTIEPHTRATVPVTVHIIGIGTVGASVGVATSDGQPFGVPAHLSITTTAYQKFARNIVWLAFGLLVLLAANNWRTRRRL